MTFEIGLFRSFQSMYEEVGFSVQPTYPIRLVVCKLCEASLCEVDKYKLFLTMKHQQGQDFQ